jgi:hypothetical protein
MKKEMDLYTDYLLSSFGQVTSTGLSTLLDGRISHDKITRMLSQGDTAPKIYGTRSNPLFVSMKVRMPV